jgi:site-specific DNA-methyltransferase (adenine-specific)
MATLTLHNGDCLEIMKEMPDKSVDLIICDLPYGCLTNQTGESKGWERPAWKEHPEIVRKNRTASACAWDIKIDLEAFWKQVKRIRRSDHSPTIQFCTTKFGYEIIKSNPDEFRYDLVWDKQRGVSFLSANKMPMRSHEMIYIFSKAGAFYERKDITGDFKNWVRTRPNDTTRKSAQYGALRNDTAGGDGKRCVLSVINPVVHKKGNHPTEKPEALYRFLIERYCPANGVVLDPTFGSGNSVFTAFAMDRSAIGIEKDDAFFKKAEERLNALP